MLTPTNLRRGIANFLSRRKFRRDFHNRFYANVTACVKTTANICTPSPGGYHSAGHFGSSVWDDIGAELSHWNAWRSPKPSSSPPVITGLRAAYAAIGGGLPYLPLPAANPPQPQLRALFIAAAALKPVANASPVFPSKCCHMLLPWEFPIWDNKFAGNTSATRQKMCGALNGWPDLDQATRQKLTTCLSKKHPDYWCYRYFILLTWDTLPIAQQTVLIKQLNAAILAAPAPLGIAPWPHFPYRTKIPELCLAGDP
jgi:hypothetical protein